MNFPCLLFLLAIAASVDAADKPTVYNHVTKEAADIDAQVSAVYATKFTITDIRDDSTYTRPRVTEGSLPRLATSADGKPLGGYVLVAFVIGLDGRVTDPVVLKTTDERLNTVATKALEGWRLEPAMLNGAAIATTGAQEFTFETAPTEFVTQTLEPTGGKISRPKDWHYVESHQGEVLLWTISREDVKKLKHYDTGLRIQFFSDVKKNTGKTPEQFILDFVAEKKKSGSKLFKTCEPEEQGLFTRQCLEIEEGPYHILYSLFWTTQTADMAVVLIAGTRKELWETYSPTFEKMSTFELLDMDRVKK
jgi:TonB family protein